MNHDPILKQAVAILADNAGLSLPPERAEALIPAAKRLQQAADWLYAQDLGLTEPAFVFDSQAQDEVQ